MSCHEAKSNRQSSPATLSFTKVFLNDTTTILPKTTCQLVSGKKFFRRLCNKCTIGFLVPYKAGIVGGTGALDQVFYVV